MDMIINKENGWVEAIIDGNCDYSKFYNSADILEKQFEIHFTSKLNDFDTFYWDFKYKESNLCLYYNIYLGVSIFPTSFNKASIADNENVAEIAKLLFERI